MLKMAAQIITGPAAWRGDELQASTEWIYHLSEPELRELETVGAAFLDADPDVRTVQAGDFPLPRTAAGLRAWTQAMDHGRGFVLVRGLRSHLYSDALSAAIFFLVGLHVGEPMRQNELGDVFDHVFAITDLSADDPKALGSRTTDRLNFHSDSSDVVALMCLRGARAGGESILISGASIYNEVARRRPDLAPLLFEDWHYDWYRQDHDAPARYYTSPMACLVDGVFSMYAGSRLIRTAQDYPEVPRMTPGQWELLDLMDEIFLEPGLPITMDFRPGDMQWLLNYSALHSRTAYQDYREFGRKRHLLRLWLRRDVGRPMVAKFGKTGVQGRADSQRTAVAPGVARTRITELSHPRVDWGVIA